MKCALDKVDLKCVSKKRVNPKGLNAGVPLDKGIGIQFSATCVAESNFININLGF